MKIALTATPYILGNVPILFQGDLESAFRIAAESRVDGVELHLRKSTDIDRKQIHQARLHHQLEIPAIGTGWAAIADGLTFTNADPEVAKAAVQRIEEHLDLAAFLKSAVIIGLILGNLGKDEGQRVSRRRAMLECLSDCCYSASRLGVDLLIEPVNRYESDHLNSLGDGLKLIDEIDSSSLKLLADTFHMNIEEQDIASSLNRAKPAHVHFADSNRQAPGHGHLEIRSILKALDEAGYTDYLSFEMLPLPDPIGALKDGIETTRKVFEELNVDRTLSNIEVTQVPGEDATRLAS